MKYLLLPFFLFTVIIYAHAQDGMNWQEPDDEDLAIEFYNKGEYEKALALFDDLMSKNKNLHLYEYYIDCLKHQNKYSEAEKYLKGLAKNETDYKYRIDLAGIYELQEDTKKATKVLDDIESEVTQNELKVQNIAANFNRKGYTDRAISVYLKGRKLQGSDELYAKDLADLYGKKADISNMAEEYLNYLRFNPIQDDVVKTAFAKYAEEQANYETIKEVLLKRIQANPNSNYYVDIFSWLLVSQKEFMAAFVQLKALDKRSSDSGTKIYELAQVSQQNKAYQVAEMCYSYLKDLGDKSPYFYRAILGKLDMQYLQITEIGEFTAEDVQKLKNEYEDFVTNAFVPFGEKHKAFLKLAELEAIYLNNTEQAIKHLEKLENNTQVPLSTRAEAKIALGNYYLLINEVWEATLKYGQVEKMFKDHPLGHEAKFLNAKLSFYRLEFEWAKAQLDVLKGSTSELIANDALQLAMLITDNLGLDTIETPLKLYATADKYLFMKKYAEAEKTLDTILEFFPNHSLEDEIFFAKAKIENNRKNYEKSLEYLEVIYTKFSHDLYSDDALYMAANIYEYKLENLSKAKEVLEKIVIGHKGSVFSVEAAKRYRALREKLSDSELFFEKTNP